MSILGRLTLEAFQHNTVVTVGNSVMGVVSLVVPLLLTYYKRWGWLWREWLTSLDPKKIGVMYGVVAFAMLFKGLVEAGMMRIQQVLAVGDSRGFMASDHFQQVFTAHGTTMIFFVAMALLFAFFNLVIPLQIGARDVAYPFLNAVSFWLFAAGAALVSISLAVGEFAATGWVSYPPLSGIAYSPGVGVDYWIWSVQIAGVGSLLSGVNFTMTILTMRCPGMTLMKAPLFIWCSLATLILILFAFPVLTATLAMLALDRLIDMRFFTASFGGNPMLYINYIWAWGHPEVYILVLPAFGIFSEVVATFSEKRLFGYVSMVIAIGAITFLSFVVWVHHFFTMGAGPSVNAFLGIMTMVIAVPTGVKIFNWIFTMCQGRVHLTTPMLWFLAFVVIFVIGGVTGVLLSIPAFDFQTHNSLFLIAHFHSTIIGGVVFAFLAGITYWFPKVFGFKLNERIGRYAFWGWVIGFMLAFIPLYILGLMGATRRLDYYSADLGWQPFFIVAAVGWLCIFAAAHLQILQIFISAIWQNESWDHTGDPWNGRTLEWSTHSPPPVYNFARIPEVSCRDPFWEQKQHPNKSEKPLPYTDILMPKNTPIAICLGGLSCLAGFAIIWYIFWLAIISFACLLITIIIRLWNDDVEETITAAQVEAIEKSYLQHEVS